MKISKGIRDLYELQNERIQRLQQEVMRSFKPLVEESGWFFYSRIKDLESFALKLETGRVKNPEYLEDFLGCTIVVQTLSQLESAEDLARANFIVSERRPKNDHETLKEPSNFQFDDIRLYLKRIPSPSGRNQDLENLVFEIQIKTALQYAWGVATHDLTYKSDTVSWPLERIAFQLKAMLEHAEIAIASANALSSSPGVGKTTKEITDVEQAIVQVQKIWPREALPSDVKRMAQSINRLLKYSGMDPGDLTQIIQDETTRLGVLPSNLSPYSLTVQALAHHQESTLRRSLSKNKISIIVHSDMELPEWVTAEMKGVIWI